MIAQKKKNNEELLKTLKDNALHKKKLEEDKKKEKEYDIQMMEDSFSFSKSFSSFLSKSKLFFLL